MIRIKENNGNINEVRNFSIEYRKKFIFCNKNYKN